ncbi:788_t:CDS:2, partial [Ambispora leptoticha]
VIFETKHLFFNPSRLLDEQEVLHNLLFVNWTWCLNVLPILWRNPFLLCQQPENRVKLVNTFVSCLSDHDKAFLTSRNPDIEIRPEPVTKYANYINVLEEKNIIESVNSWYEQLPKHSKKEKKAVSGTEATVVSAILFKMFVERSKHIKWFNLDCDLINAKWYDGTIVHQDYMADKILKSVAMHQQSLERLAIVFNSGGTPADTTELAKLVVECIKVQGRFLRDFVIENAGGEEFAEMHYALKPRVNSLKRVGYTQCDFAKFPWTVGIEILSQVEELYLIACTNLRDSQLKQLEGPMEKPFPEFYYYVKKGLE